MVLYQQVATRRCDLLVPPSTQDSRTVSLIMTCAFDEVAAPHAHFHSSCYKFVGLAATLRECPPSIRHEPAYEPLPSSSLAPRSTATRTSSGRQRRIAIFTTARGS